MGRASRRLHPGRADPLRPQETQLRHRAGPFLPRCAGGFPAVFSEPPPQGSGLSIFRAPPEGPPPRLLPARGPRASPLRLRGCERAWACVMPSAWVRGISRLPLARQRVMKCGPTPRPGRAPACL
ncbi:hypothetical protein NDU88_004166 [Pleurodeles waltl]|uniref:Uncharacterized protein n=1 Tax=Pleurodeles waltl TaxID=8319 RepID=A0AAV7UEJ8_PLEWA|nr:hypothetical protein NDU88_004166 [Pleurodeles waltl]